MNRPPYIPLAIAALLVWYENFVVKFLLHAATLGLSAETAGHVLDLAHTRFVINNNESQAQRMRDCTAMKNQLLDGDIGLVALAYPGPAALIGLTPPPVGAPPGTPGTVPTAVPAGVVARIVATVGRIVKATNYNVGIGMDLGIIAPVAPTPDLGALKPSIKVRQQNTKMLLEWKKERGTDALRIEADYGTGTFVRVADDTRPDFLDDHALPAAGQAAVWKYRAIYIKDNQPVGNYSDTVSVSVMGM